VKTCQLDWLHTGSGKCLRPWSATGRSVNCVGRKDGVGVRDGGVLVSLQPQSRTEGGMSGSPGADFGWPRPDRGATRGRGYDLWVVRGNGIVALY